MSPSPHEGAYPKRCLPAAPPEDLAHVLTHTLDAFVSLRNARIFITGGYRLFGHRMVESLLYANRELSLNIHATVLARSVAAFQKQISTHCLSLS